MKKTTIKMTAACFMLIATLGSCVKGDKGDTGATGAAGTNGTNGTNGNANVVAGAVTVNASDWTYNSSSLEYYEELTDAAITQDVVDNGAVCAFVQAGTGVWEAMPITIYTSSTQSFSINYTHYVGGATLFLTFSDATTITSSFPSLTFKLVVIGGAQRQAHPHTNWHDYNQVKEALGNEMVETTLSTAIQ